MVHVHVLFVLLCTVGSAAHRVHKSFVYGLYNALLAFVSVTSSVSFVCIRAWLDCCRQQDTLYGYLRPCCTSGTVLVFVECLLKNLDFAIILLSLSNRTCK